MGGYSLDVCPPGCDQVWLTLRGEVGHTGIAKNLSELFSISLVIISCSVIILLLAHLSR